MATTAPSTLIFPGRNVGSFSNVEFNLQRSLREDDSKNDLFLEGFNLTDLANSHFAPSGVKTLT
jgi:hypothetical protein